MTSLNWRAWRRSCSRTLSDDLPEHLRWGHAVGTAGVDAGFDLIVDAGDADHEELVEVGDEDRQELQPLDQRHRLVLGELEHAIVEVEPRQLAVEVQLRSRRGRAAPRARRPARLSVAGGAEVVSSGSLMSTRSSAVAIAVSSAGRSSTTSSPLAIPASPPLRSRDWAPVRSCTVSENDGSWPTSSTFSPRPRISSWTSNGSPASAGSIVAVTPSGSQASCGGLDGAELRARQARVDLRPEAGERLPGGLGLADAAVRQRPLVIGQAIRRFGVSEQPEHGITLRRCEPVRAR